jgi:hypothetical protein
MKTFQHEWIFQAFEEQPSFFTKRMFGGLAAYLFGRLMLVLVEPTKSGRWHWHGALICTDFDRQPEIIRDFPQLAPHETLKKWLYIDSRTEAFETTMVGVAQAIARNDGRFGVDPEVGKRSAKQRKKRAVGAIQSQLSQ